MRSHSTKHILASVLVVCAHCTCLVAGSFQSLISTFCNASHALADGADNILDRVHGECCSAPGWDLEYLGLCWCGKSAFAWCMYYQHSSLSWGFSLPGRVVICMLHTMSHQSSQNKIWCVQQVAIPGTTVHHCRIAEPLLTLQSGDQCSHTLHHSQSTTLTVTMMHSSWCKLPRASFMCTSDASLLPGASSRRASTTSATRRLAAGGSSCGPSGCELISQGVLLLMLKQAWWFEGLTNSRSCCETEPALTRTCRFVPT